MMGIFDFMKCRQSLQGSGALQGITDRHCHVLFGVDDGIRTLEESLAVLAYNEESGIREVWCTPHIMEDVPNTTAGLRERFVQLQEAYSGSVKLHLAAEYMLDNLFEERFQERDLLLMEDDTILVETSTWNPPTDMTGTLQRIRKAGYHPLLAHPERYRYLAGNGYERLHHLGVRFQLNVGSLAGYYGETAKKKAVYLLEKGLYSAVGSDCHSLRTIKEQYGREILKKDVIHYKNLLREITEYHSF